jgi:hypothetical protein
MEKREDEDTASMTNSNIEDMLVENFVQLQKVMTNLSIKFDSLSSQISKLLELFELSAKSFIERNQEEEPIIEENKELLDRLNTLLDQNKTIARGLTLLEERLRPQASAPANPYQKNQQYAESDY